MPNQRHAAALAALLALTASLLSARPLLAQAAAPAAAAPEDKQQKLIQVLQSEAPPGEKAITCKQLAVYGGKEAVPALAALLPSPELSSWARIALEAIPDPAADAALRDALAKTQGRLLVGIINSLGVRRDAAAVAVLTPKLKDADAQVAAAAAIALGKIGGDASAQALAPLLATAPTEVRSAAAYGCVLCAERFLAEGQRDQATKLYDTVRQAELPKQRILEATRGAILARQTAGIPLLLEQLRATDKAFLHIGLRVARELPGVEVTDALIAEFAKAPTERQGLLLFALADRGDAKVLPVALAAAKDAAPPVRVVAAGVLERLGNASCVPVLVDCAVADDPALAQAAVATLARLPGKDVDASLLARLQPATGRMRQVLIQLAEQRRIDGVMPVFLQCATDADPGVRTAALDAIGAIGETKQIADLLGLIAKAPDAPGRMAIEKALMAIGGRWGAACVPPVLPLIKTGDSATRITALHVLASCGGPDALAAVKATLDDADAAVQDEAVRTLSTWPNRWPQDASVLDPLLALAKTGKKPAHQVLALRGYFQFVQAAKTLNADQRLAKIKDVLPLLTRPEEKRLAISALGALGTGAAVEPLATFATDSAVADDACSTLLTLATGRTARALSKEQRQTALQTVVEKAKSEALKTKAQEALGAGK